jgi:hypothetical protein
VSTSTSASAVWKRTAETIYEVNMKYDSELQNPRVGKLFHLIIWLSIVAEIRLHPLDRTKQHLLSYQLANFHTSKSHCFNFTPFIHSHSNHSHRWLRWNWCKERGEDSSTSTRISPQNRTQLM